jgi:hypothetical protein
MICSSLYFNVEFTIGKFNLFWSSEADQIVFCNANQKGPFLKVDLIFECRNPKCFGGGNLFKNFDEAGVEKILAWGIAFWRTRELGWLKRYDPGNG